jgi:hypothetical protein
LYVRKDIGQGITLEVPRHWLELDINTRSNLAAAVAARADAAGSERSGSDTIFAMNAAPQAPGAMIRVSIQIPAQLSEREFVELLRAGGAEELRAELGHQDLAQGLSERGVTVREVFAPDLVRVDGKPAVLISYRRASSVDNSDWLVRQYHVAAGDRTITVTLSNRLTDAAIWTPILDRSLSTLVISD